MEWVFAHIIREEKGLQPLTYCRTVPRAKSVDTRLRKAYNWLKGHDLLPVDLSRFCTAQTQSNLKKVSDLYVKAYMTLFYDH